METLNIFMALMKKKEKLTRFRNNLEEEHKKAIESINYDILEIDKAIQQINNVIEETVKCPYCSGTGEKSMLDAAGSLDYVSCPHCHGTGILIDREEGS